MISNSCCIRLLISRDFQKGERMPLDQLMESYSLEYTNLELATNSKFKETKLPSTVNTIRVQSALLWPA